MERVAAAMGALQSAPIQFEASQDVPEGGVLLAVPALLAAGLFQTSQEIYTLPNGYYGMSSVFLLLALMSLARIRSVDQLRYRTPGEWGNLLGLDRIPEVRTLRRKLDLLCAAPGRAARWNTELAKEWMVSPDQGELMLYVDGHVRVYHGDLTNLPRHYVPRQRFYMRATVDYWINALGGQPFFYVNKVVDKGLVAALRDDIAPWIKAHASISEPQRQRAAADPRHPLFTLVFDREGYSPELFEQLADQQIAILSYHRYPKEDWREEEFEAQRVNLAGGEQVTMKLAERGTRLSTGQWIREVRKLGEDGHQVSLLSTVFHRDAAALAVLLMARWSQENYFKYMKEHFGLDALVEYGTEPVPDTVTTVNPAWKQLDSEIRKKHAEMNRCRKLLDMAVLDRLDAEDSIPQYQLQQGKQTEKLENLERQLQPLKEQRKKTPHHIPVKDLPEKDRFTQLLPERKHFLDTIKMICYRAETTMASIIREKMGRTDDARSLLRQIFTTEADLIPDPKAQTLTVHLHHLTQVAHDEAVKHLCENLNATESIFPGSGFRLVYKLGSG
jgi:hypothetical protein